MTSNSDNIQSPPPACPMHEANKAKEPTPPPSCPMHNKDNKEAPKLFNLDNNIPFLPNEPVSDQKTDLSLDREISSIPKANSESNWEYPSPQQFYNALKRKGWETPEDKIDVMVDIHNFLNEGAWEEVMKWERLHKCDCDDPKLLRFRGRPQELSPKAWWSHKILGAPRPFDRHDWTVDRCGKEVRYIIDYYGGPDEDGSPTFNLDVRPAIDSFESAKDRFTVGMQNFFSRFTGEKKDQN